MLGSWKSEVTRVKVVYAFDTSTSGAKYMSWVRSWLSPTSENIVASASSAQARPVRVHEVSIVRATIANSAMNGR